MIDLSSPDAALRFAYGTKPVMKISRYFADIRQSHNVTAPAERTTPWDAVAQRGMLQAFIKRLEPPLEAYAWAKYRRGAWREAGCDVITQHCMKVDHSFTNASLVRDIVGGHFGRTPPKLHLRHGVDRKTVYRQKMKLKEILHGLDIALDNAVASICS